MMDSTIKWQINADQEAVAFQVQQALVLQPVNFALSFESVELMYCQLLNARIKKKQDQKARVIRS